MRWHGIVGSAAVAMAGVLTASGPAHAQTHHHHHSGSSASPAPASTTTTTSTNTSAVVTPTAPPPNIAFFHPGQHDHSVDFEILGFFTVGGWAWPWGNFACGPGLRAGIPLMRNGPLSGLNNDLRINFGLYWMLWPLPEFTFWFTSVLTLQWNLYVTHRWSVFGEAGVALDLYPMQGANCYDHADGSYSCDEFNVHPVIGGGARYHLADHNRLPTITFRLEYPTGFDIGISF